MKKWMVCSLIVIVIVVGTRLMYSHLSSTYAQENSDRSTEEFEKVSIQDKADDTKINDETNEKLSDYIGKMSITYIFGNQTETVTNSKIASWLEVSGSEIRVNEEKIREYVMELASKYNTLNKKRKFQTYDGKIIEMDRSEYGYQIDQEKEVQQIIEDIKSKETIRRQPIYSVEGYGRNGEDDLNGNYIEISLSAQHLWLYKNGVLITDTDIVSGLPSEDRETYTGAWSIAYKASPFTLSSDIYGYSIEVQYWMPFVCGQGLHDADWQTEFGGDVYKTKGSHGCINLPPDQAKIIYETVDKGYPIIIY